MRFSLEAETLPLFLGGIFMVILFELIFSLLVLRKYPNVKKPMIGHVVFVLLAFFCLGWMLFFGPRALPDGGAVNYSGAFGLFGIFWFLGEVCAVVAVKNALFTGKQRSASKAASGSVKITKL